MPVNPLAVTEIRTPASATQALHPHLLHAVHVTRHAAASPEHWYPVQHLRPCLAATHDMPALQARALCPSPFTLR